MYMQTIFTVLLLSVICASGFHAGQSHRKNADYHIDTNPGLDNVAIAKSHNSSGKAGYSNSASLVSLLASQIGQGPGKNSDKNGGKDGGEDDKEGDKNDEQQNANSGPQESNLIDQLFTNSPFLRGIINFFRFILAGLVGLTKLLSTKDLDTSFNAFKNALFDTNSNY